MDTLNIVGCGHVGKALALLWSRAGLVEVRGILNRSHASATRAAEFLGQGRAVERASDLPPAGLVMIGASDDAIGSACADLAAACVLKKGAIVFHCSGSIPSTVLEPLREQGAHIASFHPLKTFVDPKTAADSFAGTPCGIEGDPEACAKLAQLASVCGANVIKLAPESKLLYHAATVFVCNYLTALIDAGLRCFEAAGIPREQGLALARPIIEETIRNNLTKGQAQSLTGPIARGDANLVERQHKAVEQSNPLLGNAYQALGQISVELARAKGQAREADLNKIAEYLGR